MKKRLLALLLAICMLILPGCAREDSPLFPGFDREQETQPQDQPQTQAEEQAQDNFRNSLGLSKSMMEDMVVSDVQDYGDETILRYAQTYRGVEIYGSSLMSSSADEEFVAGTYYDLTEAFDDTFDAQVAEAATVPDWMMDSEQIFFDTGSLHPVIYITENNQAVIARCFLLQAQMPEGLQTVELVTSLDGSTLYECSNLSGFDGFNAVSVEEDACDIVKDGKVYYAYNEEYNFYGISTIYKKSSQFNVDDYSKIQGNSRYLICEEDLVYSKKSGDWSSGNAKRILDAMTAYYDVADWYYRTFGHKGLNGSNGLSAIVICESMGVTLAANNSNVLVMIQPSVLTELEILAHEYGHSVFRRFTGDVGPLKNETAALSEGICDAFGVLYMGDGNWHLAESLGDDSKNIPAENRTMDDFKYNYETNYFEFLNDWTGAVYDFLGVKSGSTDFQYENAYIISHTLYKIWGNVFNKNDVAFGEVLFRSLRYLPSKATFAEFREAFLYAMRLSYPAEKVAAAQGCFSNAGIEQPEKGNIVYIEKQTAGSNEITLEDMMSLPYKDLKEMVWDEFHVSSSFDTPDTWGVQCSIGECYYTIYYYGYDFEDEDALPSQVSGQDFRKTGKKMAICDVIRTGMTYEEIAGAADVPEPYHSQVGWTTSFQMNHYFVRLFFEGDAEPSELYSAEISLDEYGVNSDTANPDSEMNTRYLLDYCTATYADIYEEFQYASYTCPEIYGDGSNVWNCTCMIGQGLSLVFDFASGYEDPAAVPIYARIDDFMYWSGSTTGAELCQGLAMGMTYSEAANTLDLSELTWAPEQSWTEPVYLCYGSAQGCALELYFIGSDVDSAILVSVNATPIG